MLVGNRSVDAEFADVDAEVVSAAVAAKGFAKVTAGAFERPNGPRAVVVLADKEAKKLVASAVAEGTGAVEVVPAG